MINGTPMQRVRDRRRLSVAPERITYLAERGLEQSVDAADTKVDGVLDGTQVFTAVNVGGVIVAENAGLADNIVTTEAIVAGDVTQASAAYTAGGLSLSDTDLAETVLQTLVVTVIAGESVILDGVMSYTGASAPMATASQLDLYLFRGASQLSPVNRILSIGNGSGQFLMPGASSAIKFIDTPGAGTFTYTLRGRVFALSGGGFLTTVSQRFLSALGTKR